MKIDFAREVALKILYKIEEEDGYSNIVLDEYLNKYREKLNIKDINLISEIVYGTITWKLTIDTILQKYSKVKLKKISKWILNILRIGAYQILFLDKVPKSAAVNESVNLTKKYGMKSMGFVNAILRKIEKEDYLEFEKVENDIEKVSKKYSIPEWLVAQLSKNYSMQNVEQICKNSNLKPKLTIRINTLKTSKENLKNELEKRNIEFEETEFDNFVNIKNIKNIADLDLFKNGFFTVQDIGAGKIAFVLNPKPGEVVLDACSAPGGKTTYIAEIMNNKGKIIALDLHEHRVKLVEENARRLGINIIDAKIKDAQILDKNMLNTFDKILLDVPCMGTGVIKRKPDIKWKRRPEDIKEITKIQAKLLDICLSYLKKDGELVYSTCSILKEENEDIVKMVLNNRKDRYEIIYKETILPDENTDGFFICKIKYVR